MSFFKLPQMCTAAVLLTAASLAAALSLSGVSSTEADSGIKAALEKGATMAVAKLGAQDGFLNNDKVRIGLPGPVEKAKPILKMLGQSKKVEELEISMNHAAESAVAEAKPLLVDAVKGMSVTDAKNILTGGETSVTEFFREKTADALTTKFLPIVKKVTDGNGLSAQYNALMSKANASGLTKENTTVESYVTQRALDGLYTMIAEEEKAIRADPVGSGSTILGKVFGAIK